MMHRWAHGKANVDGWTVLICLGRRRSRFGAIHTGLHLAILDADWLERLISTMQRLTTSTDH